MCTHVRHDATTCAGPPCHRRRLRRGARRLRIGQTGDRVRTGPREPAGCGPRLCRRADRTRPPAGRGLRRSAPGPWGRPLPRMRPPLVAMDASSPLAGRARRRTPRPARTRLTRPPRRTTGPPRPTTRPPWTPTPRRRRPRRPLDRRAIRTETAIVAAGPPCLGDDCCDTDPMVHPGQTAYFTSPSQCGSFDYDCDGTATPQYGLANCQWIGLGCTGDGFVDSTAVRRHGGVLGVRVDRASDVRRQRRLADPGLPLTRAPRSGQLRWSRGGSRPGVARRAAAPYVPGASMPSSPSLTSTLEEQTGLTRGRAGAARAVDRARAAPVPLASRGRRRVARPRRRRARAVRCPPAGSTSPACAAAPAPRVAAAIARAGPPRRLRRGRSRRRPPRRRRRRVLRPRSGGRRRRGHRRGRRARLRGERVVPLRRRQPRPARSDEPHGDALPPRARAAVARAARAGERARAQGRSAPRARRSATAASWSSRRSTATRSCASLSEAGYLRVPDRRGPRGLRRPRRAHRRVAAVDRLAGARGALRRPRPVDEAVRPRSSRRRARTRPTLKTLWLPPVREAILDAATVARAREPRDPARRGHRLADDQDARARRRRDERARVLRRRGVSARVLRRPRLASRLRPARRGRRPRRSAEPHARAARRARARGARRRRRRAGRSFLPGAFYRDEDEVVRELEARAVVALHRTAIAGAGGRGHQRLRVARTDAARPRVARPRRPDARGEGGALVARARTRRSRRSCAGSPTGRSSGLRVFITARAQTQAERIATLLRHQGVECKPRLGAFDPAWLDERGRARSRSSSVRSRAAWCSRPTGSCSSPRKRSSARARTGAASARRPRTRRAPSSRTCEASRRATTSSTPSTASAATRGSSTRPSRAATRSTSSRSSTAGGDKLYLPGLAAQPARKYIGRRERVAEARQARRQHLRAHQGARRARGAQDGRRAPAPLRRARRRSRATPLPPADDDYRAFEATLPLRRDAPTRRARSTTSTADLEAPRPMDRLVCGDVGFGKTEVALRAAFRAAMAGRQVALLCPTTVLAQQHFRTFESRMAGYPIEVRALSRFQTQEGAGGDAHRPQGRQGRRRRRHAPPALEGRPLQEPRPPRRRRRAALRRRAQGAHQAAPRAGRRAHADGDAHPAHAADGRDGPARPVAHHDGRRSTGAPCGRSSRGGTTRSCARR